MDWGIENPKKNVFVLRNLGGQTATNVRVITDHPLTRELPDGVDIPPMGSARFLLHASWGKPVPDQVQVESDGQPPQHVPVPQWF